MSWNWFHGNRAINLHFLHRNYYFNLPHSALFIIDLRSLFIYVVKINLFDSFAILYSSIEIKFASRFHKFSFFSDFSSLLSEFKYSDTWIFNFQSTEFFEYSKYSTSKFKSNYFRFEKFIRILRFRFKYSSTQIQYPNLIFKYSNSNSIIRVFRFRIFRNIRVDSISKYSNTQIQYSNIRVPKFKFDYSSIQIQNIQKYSSIQIQIRIFEYSDSEYSEIFEYQDIQIFKYSNIRVPRFKFEYSSIQIDIWISKIRIPRSCYAIIVIFDIEVSNSCRLIKFLLIQNSPRSKFNTRPLYYVRRRVYTGMRGVAASRRTNRWFLESH